MPGPNVANTPFSPAAARAAVLATALATLFGAAAAAEPPHYLLSVVKGLGVRTAVYGVNDAAWIVGEATRHPGNRLGVAFVSHGHKAQGVEMPSGGQASGATAINAHNVAVGVENAARIGGVSTAFVFQDGVRTDLPALAADIPNADARAINDAGTVAGYSSVQTGRLVSSHAVVWQDGRIVDVGAALGGISGAYAINAGGDLAGTWDADSDGVTQSAVWFDGVAQVFLPPGAASSGAVGINASRVVVGSYLTGAGPHRKSYGYAWDSGAVTRLPPLPEDSDSQAFAINDAGLIVGTSSRYGTPGHAVIWSEGVAHDLSTLVVGGTHGFVLDRATAVSPAGLIVGMGKLHGEEQSFLLTPVE